MNKNIPSIIFYDTSALLSGAPIDGAVFISTTVFNELESIKTNTLKTENIRYRARKLVKELIEEECTITKLFPEKSIQKLIKKNKILTTKNDSRIICEALLLNKERPVIFVTQDACQYLIVKKGFPELRVEYYFSQENTNELFTGWKYYNVDNKLLASIYSNKGTNILGAEENQYCILRRDGEIVDIVVWKKNLYEPLHDRELKNAYIGEKIKPRNIEQRMATDLLLNQDIKVKLLLGSYGSGKTLLALTYALEQIGRGKYDKLVFVRNNIITANTKDVGYLPGDLRDKTKIWAMCLADHLGGEIMLDQMLDDGIIEVFPISHIRGRSINKSIILCDESENLTKEHVQLLLGRVESGSEIIFCGDIKQVDAKIFEANNGINCMINALKGEQLFGMVKLLKSERGEVPKLADKLD